MHTGVKVIFSAEDNRGTEHLLVWGVYIWSWAVAVSTQELELRSIVWESLCRFQHVLRL